MNFLLVAIGGALGSVCRYSLSFIPFRLTFPMATFIANLLGCLAIGVIMGLTSSKTLLDQHTTLLLKTGFCGGFTTFSTFSLEAFQMAERGNTMLAALYIIASLVCGIACVYLGYSICK